MAPTGPTRKNRVILGLMTFGPEFHPNSRITRLDDFNQCLDYFQAQGYNEVDTARMYIGGLQEPFTAEARWKQRGLTLATKAYPTEPGSHKPAALKAIFEQSLSALQTDRVDILYLHLPDRSVPFEETLEAINDLHSQGKFSYFGLSNFTAFEVAEVVITCKERGWVRPTIYQAIYNAITRSIEPELVAACRRYGIDIVVYNPLAGGLFSGKYKKMEVPTDGRFKSGSQQGDQYRTRYFRDVYFEALQLIEPVAKRHNLTLIETALRWVVYHSALKMTKESGGNDGVIIGVSNLDQLKGNLADFEKGPLPQEVVEVLDAAWKLCKADTPDYWQNKQLVYSYDTEQALFGTQTQKRS